MLYQINESNAVTLLKSNTTKFNELISGRRKKEINRDIIGVCGSKIEIRCEFFNILSTDESFCRLLLNSLLSLRRLTSEKYNL